MATTTFVDKETVIEADWLNDVDALTYQGSLGTALTVTAGDTAAGDTAALGYTATEGAVLTGQGSTNDVTIKNDADADVLVIPTGTTNVDIVGDATAATFKPGGDTAAGDTAAIGYTATEGLVITGQGSTNDVTIKNDADADVITIPTGGTQVDLAGDATIAGAVNYKNQVTDTGGVYATPIVLTTAQSGRVLLCDDAAGLDFTLPAIGAGDIGTRFTFVVTVSVTSNNYRITAASGDLLFGGLLCIDADDVYTAPQVAFYEADGTDDLIITLNGGTTGGLVGTKVELVATSATQWFVSGMNLGDGVLATPFS